MYVYCINNWDLYNAANKGRRNSNLKVVSDPDYISYNQSLSNVSIMQASRFDILNFYFSKLVFFMNRLDQEKFTIPQKVVHHVAVSR